MNCGTIARARRHAAAPCAVDRPIVDAFGVWRVVFVGLVLLALTLWAFFWMKSKDASDELARTVAVNALVIGQIFYLLNSRYKLDSVLVAQGASRQQISGDGHRRRGDLAAAVHLRPTSPEPFETAAMPLWVWPWLFVGGFVFFLIVETEKLILDASAAEFGECFKDLIARIGAVGEEVAQPREEVVDGFDNEQRAIAVLYIGRVNRGSDHQTGGVGHDMPLAAFDLLGGIVTARPAALGGLTDWLSMTPARGWLPSGGLARFEQQFEIDPLEQIGARQS